MSTDKIRNIAIIAHVDHGKTTPADEPLKQSGALPPTQAAPQPATAHNAPQPERAADHPPALEGHLPHPRRRQGHGQPRRPERQKSSPPKRP